MMFVDEYAAVLEAADAQGSHLYRTLISQHLCTQCLETSLNLIFLPGV